MTSISSANYYFSSIISVSNSTQKQFSLFTILPKTKTDEETSWSVIATRIVNKALSSHKYAQAPKDDIDTKPPCHPRAVS